MRHRHAFICIYGIKWYQSVLTGGNTNDVEGHVGTDDRHLVATIFGSGPQVLQGRTRLKELHATAIPPNIAMEVM